MSEHHKQRHIELHAAFDELVADFIANTNGRPSDTSVIELIRWSHEQTLQPVGIFITQEIDALADKNC